MDEFFKVWHLPPPASVQSPPLQLCLLPEQQNYGFVCLVQFCRAAGVRLREISSMCLHTLTPEVGHDLGLGRVQSSHLPVNNPRASIWSLASCQRSLLVELWVRRNPQGMIWLYQWNHPIALQNTIGVHPQYSISRKRKLFRTLKYLKVSQRLTVPGDRKFLILRINSSIIILQVEFFPVTA